MPSNPDLTFNFILARLQFRKDEFAPRQGDYPLEPGHINIFHSPDDIEISTHGNIFPTLDIEKYLQYSGPVLLDSGDGKPQILMGFTNVHYDNFLTVLTTEQAYRCADEIGAFTNLSLGSTWGNASVCKKMQKYIDDNDYADKEAPPPLNIKNCPKYKLGAMTKIVLSDGGVILKESGKPSPESVSIYIAKSTLDSMNNQPFSPIGLYEPGNRSIENKLKIKDLVKKLQLKFSAELCAEAMRLSEPDSVGKPYNHSTDLNVIVGIIQSYIEQQTGTFKEWAMIDICKDDIPLELVKIYLSRNRPAGELVKDIITNNLTNLDELLKIRDWINRNADESIYSEGQMQFANNIRSLAEKRITEILFMQYEVNTPA